MSAQYVRVGGSIYGPFSSDQLAQMRAAGRINDQSEVSADRVTWHALGGAAISPPAAASMVAAVATSARASGAGRPCPDTKSYVDQLRNQTRYPFYRTSVLVASILGYVLAAMPFVALVVQILWFGLSSIHVLQPIGALVGGAVLVVIVTVIKEVASMYADFVDSTLSYHARDFR